jgi:hypothetical protein
MDQLRTMNLTAIWRHELNFYLIKDITSVAHMKSMKRLKTLEALKTYSWKYAKFPH